MCSVFFFKGIILKSQYISLSDTFLEICCTPPSNVSLDGWHKCTILLMIFPQYVASTPKPRWYDTEPSFLHRGDPHFSSVWRPGDITQRINDCFSDGNTFFSSKRVDSKDNSNKSLSHGKDRLQLFMTGLCLKHHARGWKDQQKKKKHKVQASYTRYTFFFVPRLSM